MSQDINPEVEDDYKDRYVAYLDLLGFKAQVESAERDIAERAKLREILRLVKYTLGENPSIGLRFKYFSDCIVVSAERTAEGLREIFQSISALTSNLLQYDVFVRGGLTGGGAYNGADFVYGTAVSRAVDIERQCAKHPITLISQEVVDDAKLYGAGYLEWLIEDSPGRHFVHYLRRYAEYRPMPIYPGKVILDDPGRRVIDFVCQRLNRDKGTILAKAEWLRAYWNRTVAVHGVFGSIEAGVMERYICDGPTIVRRRMAAPQTPEVTTETPQNQTQEAASPPVGERLGAKQHETT